MQSKKKKNMGMSFSLLLVCFATCYSCSSWCSVHACSTWANAPAWGSLTCKCWQDFYGACFRIDAHLLAVKPSVDGELEWTACTCSGRTGKNACTLTGPKSTCFLMPAPALHAFVTTSDEHARGLLRSDAVPPWRLRIP